MEVNRYAAADLIDFGTRLLSQPAFGFSEKQAHAAATILVEADLRGDSDHGIACGDKLNEIYAKVQDDAGRLGFKRICTPKDLEKSSGFPDFVPDERKYPTIITVDAGGLLGHYVAIEILPELIRTAKRFGMAKAYIRNSTHFGNCGIYSERIAECDLAAKVSCTTPAWTKPFIELRNDPKQDGARYEGVEKRFGTNPVAWSIPYDEGIVTIDMATTQRAVSPAVNAANHNAAALGIAAEPGGPLRVGRGEKRVPLRDVHLSIARMKNDSELQKALSELGYAVPVLLEPAEEGLVKGPAGEDIRYPLAFDEVFKNQFWIAPLGGTFFGYKGFGLAMLVELDHVMGGGEPGLIRELDADGKPNTPERVAHTLEAYAIDMLYPLDEAKRRLGESVRTTRRCGNRRMFLPGEKERLSRAKLLAGGIPLTGGQIEKLRSIAEKARLAFRLKPV